ncbi:MAG: cytochrome c [Proteobacteria bacterium]|nr:cytochrome c [Pseudomonadota bacterium]
MTKARILASAILGAAMVASAANAADPAAGKQKFEATCAACHGMQGISIAPIYPNLAGQKQEYLVTQLKAFRDGSRKNAIMQPMAKGLTDADIVNIAAYLAALKP